MSFLPYLKPDVLRNGSVRHFPRSLWQVGVGVAECSCDGDFVHGLATKCGK